MFFNRKKRERTEADRSYAQARGETTTQVRFRQPVCPAPRMLSTQNGERSIDAWEPVESALREMLTDGDQFVVLSVGEHRQDVFFVQTTPSNRGDGFVLQVSVRDGSGSRLVERVCSWEECRSVFRKFYDTAAVDGLERYKPVEFYR